MNGIDAREQLCRYLYSKNHYKSSTNKVKYTAFMPPQNRRLSVLIISGLNEREIWSLGEGLREMDLLARAEIRAAYVYQCELTVEADNNPERHANIVGWPEAASAIKLKAMELAENACLRLL